MSPQTDELNDQAVSQLVFVDGGRRLRSISAGVVRTWDVESGTLTNELDLSVTGRSPIVVLSSDGSRAAVLRTGAGLDSRIAEVWEVETRRRTSSIIVPPHGTHVAPGNLAVSDDGRVLATAAAHTYGRVSRLVRVWDTVTGAVLRTSRHWDDLHHLALTTDDVHGVYAAWSDCRVVQVWERNSGRTWTLSPEGVRLTYPQPDHLSALPEHSRALPEHPRPLIDIPLSDLASRRVPLCAGMSTRQPPRVDVVRGVWLCPNRDVVVATTDSGLYRWDLDATVSPAVSKLPQGRGISLDVTPDGRSAVTGDVDMTMRWWDVETFQCLGSRSVPGAGGVTAVRFHPDGRHVAVGTQDGTIRFEPSAPATRRGSSRVIHGREPG
jgi:WD40 repeat protein